MKTISMKCISVLLVLLCVACTNSNRYANVIPKDAPIVTSVNLMALGEKASLKDYKGLIDMGLMQVQESDADLYEQLKGIVDDPSSLGLSLDDPLYVFMLEDGENGAAVMKVTDGDKVKQLAQQFLPQQGIECTEEDGQLWIAAPAAIVVTDDLLLVGPDRVTLEKLMEQSASESFTSTELWDDLATIKGDIKLSVTQGKLMQANELVNNPDVLALYQAMGIDLDECRTVAGLDFQAGKVVMTSKNHNSKEFEKMQKKLVGKVDGCFMKKMPANPAMWMTMNLDGKAMAELMARIFSVVPETKSLNMEEIKPLIETIDGELSLAFNGLNAGGMIPDLTIFAQVKNNIWEEKLKELTANQSVQEMLDYGMVGDDVFYLTTNSEVIANTGKNLSESVADEEWAANVDGTYAYFVVETDHIKQLAGMFLNTLEMKEINAALNLIEWAEAKSYSLDEGEMTIHFSNKEENGLKQLIKLGVSMSM